MFFPQEAEIVRTRDTAVLAECDVVVDVGGEFDPKRHRYDHHQRYRYIQANFALETRNKYVSMDTYSL